MLLLRPRRSALYMPGSNARAIEKARSLAADVLILDLEDAVAPPARNVVQVDGQMMERLHLAAARRDLAAAEIER